MLFTTQRSIWVRLVACFSCFAIALHILASPDLKISAALIVSHLAIAGFSVLLATLAREKRRTDRVLVECELDAHKFDITAEDIDRETKVSHALTPREKSAVLRAANRTDKIRKLVATLGPDVSTRFIRTLGRELRKT